MHVVVSIKQVPDTKNVRVDPDTHALVRQGVESKIDPFDLFAVEAALKLKDANGARVTAITLGPPQAAEALRDTPALGIDDAVLLSDHAFAGSDTWATSTTLSAAIRKMGDVDLIFCGKQAIDGDTAQVGPEMAALLDLPYATFVKKIELLDGNFLKAFRQTDEGTEVWKLPPARSHYRYQRDRRAARPVPQAQDARKKDGNPRLERSGPRAQAGRHRPVRSFTQVVRVFNPPQRSNRVLIQGMIDEQVERRFKGLKQSGVPGL